MLCLLLWLKEAMGVIYFPQLLSSTSPQVDSGVVVIWNVRIRENLTF